MRAAALAAAAVLLVGAACSGGADGDTAAEPEPTSSTTVPVTAPPPPPPGVEVEVLSSAVVGVADDEPLPQKTTDDVLDIVEKYVQRAMVDPMVEAAPAVELDTLFSDASLQAAVRGADRRLLVDEGLPRIEPHPEARAKVRLFGFRGPGGTVEMVGARVRIRVTGRTADGRKVQVIRAGDISLVPQGHWRIESYELDVERQVEAAQPA